MKSHFRYLPFPIHLLITINLIFLIQWVLGCAAQGPPYRDVGDQKPNLSELNVWMGHHRFVPHKDLYPGYEWGDLILRPRFGDQVDFLMQIAGTLPDGEFQIRSYRGSVVKNGSDHYLQFMNCTLYGARNIEKKIWPLQKWQCEHIRFLLFYDPSGAGDPSHKHSESGVAYHLIIQVPGEERRSGEAESQTETWPGDVALLPVPMKKDAYIGQVVAMLPGVGPVVWGGVGTSRLRGSGRLYLVDGLGKRVALVEATRFGTDGLIFCTWTSTPPADLLEDEKWHTLLAEAI